MSSNIKILTPIVPILYIVYKYHRHYNHKITDKTDNFYMRIIAHEVGHLVLFQHFKQNIRHIVTDVNHECGYGYVQEKGYLKFNLKLSFYHTYVKIYLSGFLCERMIHGEEKLDYSTDLKYAREYIDCMLETGYSELGIDYYGAKCSEFRKNIYEKAFDKIMKKNIEETEVILKTHRAKIDQLIDFIYVNKIRILNETQINYILKTNKTFFDHFKYYLNIFAP